MLNWLKGAPYKGESGGSSPPTRTIIERGSNYMTTHRYIDPFSGKSKSRSYQRKIYGKQKLKKLYNNGASGYPWPIVWSDYVWDDTIGPFHTKPAPNAYLKHCWRGKRSSDLKKISHRMARRKEIYNSTYHKQFDFWWEYD